MARAHGWDGGRPRAGGSGRARRARLVGHGGGIDALASDTRGASRSHHADRVSRGARGVGVCHDRAGPQILASRHSGDARRPRARGDGGSRRCRLVGHGGGIDALASGTRGALVARRAREGDADRELLRDRNVAADMDGDDHLAVRRERRAGRDGDGGRRRVGVLG